MLRRDVIRSIAGGALGSGLAFGQSARAQSFADLGSLNASVINARAAFSAMGPFKNIAILGYNLGLVVQSEIKAFGGAGSAQSSTAATLTGLTIDHVQTIADHALVDFADVLRQTGRPLLLMDTISQAPSFATLKASPVPFRKQPAADARRVMMVPPHGMNLMLTNADSPITDKSPFDLKNAMALSHLSFELDAVVLIPNIIIDFAQFSSSGNSVYSSSASTGIDPGMYLVELWTGLGAYHGRNKFGGDGGRAQLQKRVRLGQGGATRTDPGSLQPGRGRLVELPGQQRHGRAVRSRARFRLQLIVLRIPGGRWPVPARSPQWRACDEPRLRPGDRRAEVTGESRATPAAHSVASLWRRFCLRHPESRAIARPFVGQQFHQHGPTTRVGFRTQQHFETLDVLVVDEARDHRTSPPRTSAGAPDAH